MSLRRSIGVRVHLGRASFDRAPQDVLHVFHGEAPLQAPPLFISTSRNPASIQVSKAIGFHDVEGNTVAIGAPTWLRVKFCFDTLGQWFASENSYPQHSEPKELHLTLPYVGWRQGRWYDGGCALHNYDKLVAGVSPGSCGWLEFSYPQVLGQVVAASNCPEGDFKVQHLFSSLLLAAKQLYEGFSNTTDTIKLSVLRVSSTDIAALCLLRLVVGGKVRILVQTSLEVNPILKKQLKQLRVSTNVPRGHKLRDSDIRWPLLRELVSEFGGELVCEQLEQRFKLFGTKLFTDHA